VSTSARTEDPKYHSKKRERKKEKKKGPNQGEKLKSSKEAHQRILPPNIVVKIE